MCDDGQAVTWEDKDIPLSIIYDYMTLQFVSSNDQSICTTILRLTKVVYNFSLICISISFLFDLFKLIIPPRQVFDIYYVTLGNV